MAAPLDAESSTLNPVWYKIPMLVGNLHSYTSGQVVHSDPQGPNGSFKARLKVFPKGTEGYQGWFSAFVELLPPPDLADTDWSCPGIRFSISVCQNGDWWKRWFDTFDFAKKTSDRGWHKVIPWRDIWSWFDVNHQICLEGLVRLPLAVATKKSAEQPWTRPLDLTLEPTFVKFLLPESQNIFFDKRLLTARSEYFAEMFCQPAWREARTNEVDMSSDEDATVRSVKALCVYLMADTFHAEGDIELALSVRRLADRYRLTGLVEKTEQELELMLCADNALSFLATVTGTGGHLEQACLALIEADNCELLEQQQEKLDVIAEANPDLVRQLFRLLLAARGKKRRTE